MENFQSETEKLLAIIRWSANDLSDALDINPRVVFRWKNGQNETPPNVLMWLRHIAAYHLKNNSPEGWNWGGMNSSGNYETAKEG
jgi:hypothetical protein